MKLSADALEFGRLPHSPIWTRPQVFPIFFRARGLEAAIRSPILGRSNRELCNAVGERMEGASLRAAEA